MIWGNVRVSLVTGAQDSARLIMAITEDITERKRAEERLRCSEQFLAEGQRMSHTGCWGWNVSSGETFFSQETFRILGYDLEQAAPSDLTAIERIHPDDRALVQGRIEESHSRKERFAVDTRLVLPDGSTEHAQIVAHTAIGEHCDLEFVGTIMDVTERKRAEETLQATQAQLAHIARVATMGELAASIGEAQEQIRVQRLPYARVSIRDHGGGGPTFLSAGQSPPRPTSWPRATRPLVQSYIDDLASCGYRAATIHHLGHGARHFCYWLNQSEVQWVAAKPSSLPY